MDTYTVNIKNMVCNRCIWVVGKIFDDLGLKPINIELGKVLLQGNITPVMIEKINAGLEQHGFEIITDKGLKLVEEIKVCIIQLIHDGKLLNINISDYLVRKCNKDYSYLSKLFSQTNGISIEKYYILQKIERVKELLVYGELTLSEIAYSMGYSSVAHLSKQFKNTTGMTTKVFRQLKNHGLKPIDML